MVPSDRGTYALLGAALAAAVAALALAAAYHWRIGLTLLGVVLLASAVARGLLPVRRVGLLAVRSRSFDVSLLATLGVALIAITATLGAQT